MTTKQEIINKFNRNEDPELLREIDKWIGSIPDASNPEQFSKQEFDVGKTRNVF